MLSCLVIAWVRPELVLLHRAAKPSTDSSALPSPALTRAMSLGYRAALADLLFAHVLVSYGQHVQEKRRFELAGFYLDVVTTLDPSFREPYRLADTLITLQAKPPSFDDYLIARRLLERGLAAFPSDSELWLIAGQFLAHLASNYVPPDQRDAWRLDGARKLARSCELAGSGAESPRQCLTAASLFSRFGSADVARNFLERVVTITDDPNVQAAAGGYLFRAVGQAERDRVEERGRRLRAAWSADLTFVSKEALLLLGPRFDPAACAGVPGSRSIECATNFRDWGDRVELE